MKTKTNIQIKSLINPRHHIHLLKSRKPECCSRLILASIFLFTGLSVFSTFSYFAENLSSEEIKEQIEALEEEIDNYRATIESTQNKKEKLQKNLEENEKKIGDLLKKIEAVEGDLDKSEKNVQELQNKKNHLELSKQEQQQLITQQVRAAYKTGKQEYLKVLLNQEDPHQISRMLVYYDYFNQARVQQIDTFNHTIQQLKIVENQLSTEKHKLIEDRQLLENRHQSLSEVQNERGLALLELDRFIQVTGSELKDRINNRARLEELLQKITASIANLPTPEEILPFSSMRGKLYLPVTGSVLEKYGSSRHEGKLKRNGLYIAAKTGTPVHAVHYGRVVFSDWLRGFGLLLIISHGEGYMSLYGHNQLLYMETGDWVSAGDMIARIGNSGGQQQAGLYFEIRKAGKPKDPQLWCLARPARAA